MSGGMMLEYQLRNIYKEKIKRFDNSINDISLEKWLDKASDVNCLNELWKIVSQLPKDGLNSYIDECMNNVFLTKVDKNTCPGVESIDNIITY